MLSAINNWKNIQHQNEKTMIKQDQQEQLSIMTEENYYDVKYMLDSFECIVDGDFCTINQSREDDSLAKDVKCLKDISYNHGCNQYSTIETLNLVKSKLEDLKELQSHDIITKAIISIKEKFRKIFYK